MTRVDVGPIPLEHPRAAVRARRRPGGAGRAARQDDGHAARPRAFRDRPDRCRDRRRGRRGAHARRLALRRRPRDAARHGVLDHDRAARRARHVDAGRADRPQRRDRVRGRPRDPRRHRPARPHRAAGPAPYAQRQAAARPPDRPRRARGGAGGRRARSPRDRPQGPDRRLRRRLRAARLRPHLLRRAHPSRDPHLLALPPPGRPAGRRRLHLARRLAGRAARDRPDDARLLPRPRARARRRRDDRHPRRARHRPHRRLLPARRRPHGDATSSPPRRPTSARACAP